MVCSAPDLFAALVMDGLSESALAASVDTDSKVPFADSPESSKICLFLRPAVGKNIALYALSAVRDSACLTSFFPFSQFHFCTSFTLTLRWAIKL